jgi:hypothetical protein
VLIFHVGVCAYTVGAMVIAAAMAKIIKIAAGKGLFFEFCILLISNFEVLTSVKQLKIRQYKRLLK